MLTLEMDPQGGNDDRLPKVCLVRAAILGCPRDGGWTRASTVLTSHCLIVTCSPSAPGCPVPGWVLGTEKPLGRGLSPVGDRDLQTLSYNHVQSRETAGAWPVLS